MFEYFEGDIGVDGINIHYYRTGGNKPPFVLLHGATDNGLCWTRVAERLAEEYDVVLPDAQGHGLSDRLDDDFTYKRRAVQTVALVHELGLGEPLVMGHSMGADTAVDIAVSYPSLPKAIILEDPPWMAAVPPESANNEAARKQAEAFRESLVALGRLTLDEVVEESRKRDPQWPEEERLPWARAKLQFDPTLFSRQVIDPRSYEELVPEIRCPTLLIIAESGLTTAAVAENAAALWKSDQPFRWVQIKNATHNIRRDQFETFYEALFGFLKELSDQ